MDELKQDDQQEHTYSSYVRIRDVAQKTCQRRWTIGKSGERGSGISVLAARHDDDDDVYIYIYIYIYREREREREREIKWWKLLSLLNIILLSPRDIQLDSCSGGRWSNWYHFRQWIRRPEFKKNQKGTKKERKKEKEDKERKKWEGDKERKTKERNQKGTKKERNEKGTKKEKRKKEIKRGQRKKS